jgi:hypothetical protein
MGLSFGEGTKAIIPPKRNSRTPRANDAELYKERNRIEELNRIECFFKKSNSSGAS